MDYTAAVKTLRSPRITPILTPGHYPRTPRGFVSDSEYIGSELANCPYWDIEFGVDESALTFTIYGWTFRTVTVFGGIEVRGNRVGQDQPILLYAVEDSDEWGTRELAAFAVMSAIRYVAEHPNATTYAVCAHVAYEVAHCGENAG